MTHEGCNNIIRVLNRSAMRTVLAKARATLHLPLNASGFKLSGCGTWLGDQICRGCLSWCGDGRHCRRAACTGNLGRCASHPKLCGATTPASVRQHAATL